LCANLVPCKLNKKIPITMGGPAMIPPLYTLALLWVGSATTAKFQGLRLSHYVQANVNWRRIGWLGDLSINRDPATSRSKMSNARISA
jgi:hypothetical protein